MFIARPQKIFFTILLILDNLEQSAVCLSNYGLQYISDWVCLMASDEAELRPGKKTFSSTFTIFEYNTFPINTQNG